ncbi:hypothetical protein BVRB_8g198610 [Beta vulgaris subsp. vulgaris]|nr:hypothetical protein BVRB_8g198610 [Beta vulgaris subsp. vulgaris]
MNNNKTMIDIQRQESLKRRWHDSFYTRLLSAPPQPPTNPTPTAAVAAAAAASSPLIIGKPPHFLQPGRLDGGGGGGGGDLYQNVVPPVTVVLEGRSICQRVNLQQHANYESLAKALRQMFMDMINIQQNHEDESDNGSHQLDLSNALPGYLVAYEDMENDLLLAGDLHWKDFVRVAKRIRILPVKSSSRKQRSTKH